MTAAVSAVQTIPNVLGCAWWANPVLRTEGRVNLVDAILAAAVLLGLVLNTVLGWWWADPVVGLVVAGYAAREAFHLLGVPQETL